MRYTVHQAKTNLSRLLKQAAAGEEVIICRGDEPVAKIVPVTEQPRRRIAGQLAGQISWTPDAFDPLTDKELKDLGFE